MHCNFCRRSMSCSNTHVHTTGRSDQISVSEGTSGRALQLVPRLSSWRLRSQRMPHPMNSTVLSTAWLRGASATARCLRKSSLSAPCYAVGRDGKLCDRGCRTNLVNTRIFNQLIRDLRSRWSTDQNALLKGCADLAWSIFHTTAKADLSRDHNYVVPLHSAAPRRLTHGPLKRCTSGRWPPHEHQSALHAPCTT